MKPYPFSPLRSLCSNFASPRQTDLLFGVFIFWLLFALPCWAAFPPIGPAPNRVIPLDKEVSFFVSVNGNDRNNGKTRKSAFRTIQRAVDTAHPGNTILVTNGVYRQGFWIHDKLGTSERWLNIIAEPGVIITGADIVTNWKVADSQPDVYFISRPHLYPNSWQSPQTPLTARPEQVFIDGKIVPQIATETYFRSSKETSFWVDDINDLLYLRLKGKILPNDVKIAVTMRTWAIQIGGPPNVNLWEDPAVGFDNKVSFVRIEGFTIRNIGNFSRQAAVQVRGVCNNIIIENCDVQWANYSAVAISGFSRMNDFDKKWFHVRPQQVSVKNCLLSNNGVQGLHSESQDGAMIENNIIDRNNYKRNSLWNEGGAIKMLDCEKTTIKSNIARNNANHGIWLDYAGSNNVIENNLVFHSQAAGILNEVTPRPRRALGTDGKSRSIPRTPEERKNAKEQGTVIQKNIVIGTRAPGGSGIANSNSFNATISNNICYKNGGAGISLNGDPARFAADYSFNNTASKNICISNMINGSVVADREGQFFLNRQFKNLYTPTPYAMPFLIGQAAVGTKEWEKVNERGFNRFTVNAIFVDANRWNFSILDPSEIDAIDFQTEGMRLDWSEFFTEPQDLPIAVER